MKFDEPQPDWEMISPGVYFDPFDNQMHVFVEEVLAHLSLPDTPENCAIVQRQLIEVFKERYPGRPVFLTEE